MSRNGSGVYTLNTAGQPVVAGTTITATAFNAATTDIATALTQSICVDGQSVVTGNIPMATHKLTGVGAATAANDALTFAGAGNFAGMVGTTTNDSATALRVGEIVTSTVTAASPVTLTTSTPANVTSISLTAGDWDVSATSGFIGDSATSVNYSLGCISATSATVDSTVGYRAAQVTAGDTIYTYLSQISFTIGPLRISLAGTTTYYLVAQASFGVGANYAFGNLRARRVR